MIFDLASFSSMTRLLDGIRVATTENRYPEQLARLLEREGATVYSCPLLRETPVEHIGNARQFMELCESTKVDFIVFYTGVGVEFLFRETNNPEVVARSRIIARGPKAVNALKKFGVQGYRYCRRSDNGGHSQDAGTRRRSRKNRTRSTLRSGQFRTPTRP